MPDLRCCGCRRLVSGVPLLFSRFGFVFIRTTNRLVKGKTTAGWYVKHDIPYLFFLVRQSNYAPYHVYRKSLRL